MSMIYDKLISAQREKNDAEKSGWVGHILFCGVSIFFGIWFWWFVLSVIFRRFL